MALPVLSLKILLLLTLLNEAVFASVIVPYGESCSVNDCDRQANLICNDSNMCDCEDTSKMIVDETRCVVMAGKICVSEFGRYSTNQRKLTCVQNANCVSINRHHPTIPYCQCLPGFYPSETGQCKLKRYGTSCDTNYDCGTDTHLICNKGICTCNPSLSVYNETRQQCIGKVGAPCDEYGKPWGENMNCYEDVCVCDTNFFRTKSGDCERKRGYYSSCSDHTDSCQPPFICDSEFRCSCNSTTSIYDQSKGTCSKLVGAECFYSEDCVTNAACKWFDYKTSKCQCSRGFLNTTSGQCAVEHGHTCTQETTQMCGAEQQATVCREGQCSCINGQEFDETRRKCVAKVYSRCNDTISCTENTHCAPVSEEGNDKFCICNEGLVSVDDNCHPTVGQPCDYKPTENSRDNRTPSKICDPLASLQCVNGICQCQHMEYYDNISQKCRGLIGATCELENVDDIGNDIYCTSNANCISRRALLKKQGVCTCKLGWKYANDGYCGK